MFEQAQACIDAVVGHQVVDHAAAEHAAAHRGDLQHALWARCQAVKSRFEDFLDRGRHARGKARPSGDLAILFDQHIRFTQPARHLFDEEGIAAGSTKNGLGERVFDGGAKGRLDQRPGAVLRQRLEVDDVGPPWRNWAWSRC